jgi:hypothetical protein
MILEDILIQAGVDFKPQRGDPAEVVMPCPFCAGQFDTMSERKVFGLNLENGKAHCYRCDWRARTVSYTARRLCEAFDIDFSWRMRLAAGFAESTLVEPDEAVPEPIDLPVGYERFTGSKDRIEAKAMRYLQERGITASMIRKYQIGYAAVGEFAWRVILPVIGDDGQVYGFVGRDFSGTAKVKYLNSTDHVKILWGLNGIKGGTVILMEGIIDAIRSNLRLEERGWSRRAINAATLGSTITDVQIEQLRKFKQTVHFPDWDKAGVKGVLQRAPATHEAGIKTFVAIPKVLDERDPDSMDAAAYFRAVRTAKPWSLATKMRLRLLLAS